MKCPLEDDSMTTASDLTDKSGLSLWLLQSASAAYDAGYIF